MITDTPKRRRYTTFRPKRVASLISLEGIKLTSALTRLPSLDGSIWCEDFLDVRPREGWG